MRASTQRRLRRWLVALIVVALPWPVLATLRMADCAGVGMASAAGAAAVADRMADMAPMAPLAHPAQPQPHDGCGACAACAVGAVLPSRPIVVPSLDRSDVLAATVGFHVTTRVAAGLERPPPRIA